LRKYKTALQHGGGTLDGSSKAEEKQTSGAVLRVYKEKTGDFTIVSILLDNKKNYIISSETNPLAIYVKEGDQVKITYMETGETFLPVKELVIQGLE